MRFLFYLESCHFQMWLKSWRGWSTVEIMTWSRQEFRSFRQALRWPNEENNFLINNVLLYLWRKDDVFVNQWQVRFTSRHFQETLWAQHVRQEDCFAYVCNRRSWRKDSVFSASLLNLRRILAFGKTSGLAKSFTISDNRLQGMWPESKYNCLLIVYFSQFSSILSVKIIFNVCLFSSIEIPHGMYRNMRHGTNTLVASNHFWMRFFNTWR